MTQPRLREWIVLNTNPYGLGGPDTRYSMETVRPFEDPAARWRRAKLFERLLTQRQPSALRFRLFNRVILRHLPHG